jgi:hypothetical protein
VSGLAGIRRTEGPSLVKTGTRLGLRWPKIACSLEAAEGLYFYNALRLLSVIQLSGNFGRRNISGHSLEALTVSRVVFACASRKGLPALKGERPRGERGIACLLRGVSTAQDGAC